MMKLHQYFEFGPSSQNPFSFCQIQLALDTVYAYPRLGIGFLAFLAFGLSCLIAFFRLSSDAGLATALASPCQEWSSLK